MTPTRFLSLFATLSLCLSACGSRPPASPKGGAPGLPPFAALFEEKRYPEAYEEASRIATTQRGSAQQQASLIAGLSAQAMNRNAEAVRWLGPLRKASDPSIAGRSHAALGLIAQERGGHEEAAESLRIASQKLPGDEGARAALYAGDSYRTLGKEDQARASYERAQTLVTGDDTLRMMIGDRLRGGKPSLLDPRPRAPQPTNPDASTSTLTVQVGAFEHLSTANQYVARLAGKFNTRVVPLLKNGKRLYAVRVGTFSSRSAADAVRVQVEQASGTRPIVTVASGE